MKNFSQETPKYIRASFSDRALAMFLDLMIITALSFPVSMGVGGFDYFYRQMHEESVSQFYEQGMLSFNVLFEILVGFLYFGYYYSKRGTSLGKSILNLKVLCLPYAEFPSYKTAFIRDLLGKFLSTAVFFFGYLMVFFRKDRRALHDLLSDTVVIKRIS